MAREASCSLAGQVPAWQVRPWGTSWLTLARPRGQKFFAGSPSSPSRASAHKGDALQTEESISCSPIVNTSGPISQPPAMVIHSSCCKAYIKTCNWCGGAICSVCHNGTEDHPAIMSSDCAAPAAPTEATSLEQGKTSLERMGAQAEGSRGPRLPFFPPTALLAIAAATRVPPRYASFRNRGC